jgi:hypothetical protein
VPDLIPEPVEAKKYLERKAIVETESWDDLKHGEHAHAFTVAHSRNAGVLNDIFGLLNTAMAEGKSINVFKKEMYGLMEKKGWYGRSDKGPDDKAYINWRTALIYHVNMRTAYEAGRYRSQVRGAELRPIWEYVSQLVGKHRREEHIALHGKAFRWDDPFWDEFRPPNGWGCECSVVTLSEAAAEREGVEVLETDADGKPPALVDRKGNAVDWTKFASPEWKYNPGREALAPNFGNYKGLANCRMPDGRSALAHVVDRYRRDMDTTRLSENEFNVLLNRVQQADYKRNDIPIQIGNLEKSRHEAMLDKAGVIDSKTMAAARELRHGTFTKITDQKVPADQQKFFYQMFSHPERIYENLDPKSPHLGREFHFVNDPHDGKVIKLVFRQQNKNMALRLETIGKVVDEYRGPNWTWIY